MGDILHERLARDCKSRFPQIGSVDGKGLVAGVACVRPGHERAGRRSALGRGSSAAWRKAC